MDTVTKIDDSNFQIDGIKEVPVSHIYNIEELKAQRDKVVAQRDSELVQIDSLMAQGNSVGVIAK